MTERPEAREKRSPSANQQQWQLIAIGSTAFVVVWLLPLVYTVYIVIHTGHGWLPGGYMQSMMSSWLATVVGVAAGLPFALWLNRQVERRGSEAAAEHARSQRQRVIAVLRHELERNVGPLKSAATRHVTRVRFYSARWNALSAGGELRWLPDVELLDLLSGAYEAIEIVNTLASEWLRALVEPAGSEGRGEVILELLSEAAGDCVKAVETALGAIDAA